RTAPSPPVTAGVFPAASSRAMKATRSSNATNTCSATSWSIVSVIWYRPGRISNIWTRWWIPGRCTSRAMCAAAVTGTASRPAVAAGGLHRRACRPAPATLNRLYPGAAEARHARSVDNQPQFEFVTGELAQTLVTGLDYQRRKTKVAYDDAAFGTVPPINPFTGAVGSAVPVFTHQYDEARFLEQTGLYVQDLISLGNWRLSLGARQDWVDMEFQQTESRFGDQADDARIDQFSG